MMRVWHVSLIAQRVPVKTVQVVMPQRLEQNGAIVKYLAQPIKMIPVLRHQILVRPIQIAIKDNIANLRHQAVVMTREEMERAHHCQI